MTMVAQTFERYLGLLGARSGERILNIGPARDGLDRSLAALVGPDGQSVTAEDFDLPFADNTFDAAMCVGQLAQNSEPRKGMSAVRRVLRGGGRLVVACADEDTRIYNGHDRARGRRIARAIANRKIDPWMGRRLAHTLALAGFHLVRELVWCEVERHFQPGLAGYELAHCLRAEIVSSGEVEAHEYDAWLGDLRAAEWDGSYCYAVTTFAYLAERE
jgi:SAM-dependent methyltransferase